MTEGARMVPQPQPHLTPGLRMRVVCAALAMFWEKLWRVIWLPSIALVFFIALSLFDVWRFIPAALHALALAGIVLGFVVQLLRQRHGFKGADETAILARIEQENALAHHPLLGLQDRLELGSASPEAQTLWQAHLLRLRASLPVLRFVMPRPQIIRSDYFGLRQMAGIMVIAGLLVAGGESLERIRLGFQPAGPKIMPPLSQLEAWITPPGYTGMAPILLAGRIAAHSPQSPAADSALISAPTGSALSLRLFGSAEAEVQLIPASGKRTVQPLTKIDSANAQAAIKLERSQEIVLHQSGMRDRVWNIKIIPDHPPVIGLLDEIKTSRKFALAIRYGATDDYAITSITAVFTLARDATRPPHRVDLPLPPRDSKKSEQMVFVDLTAHPWAGQPVRLHLIATDAAAQTGTTPPVDLILPQRPFSHPLARALVEQRGVLALTPPDESLPVVNALDALSLYPDRFTEDFPVYLNLRAARHRLALTGQVPENRQQAGDLLWTLALRLEDGNLSLAAGELRDLQQKLMQALRNGAGEEEIVKLTDAIREALKNYLQAMRDQSQENAGNGETPGENGGPENNQTLKQSDLESLLEQIEKLGKTGARQAAQDMLSRLQTILENLQAARPGGEKNPRQQLYGDALDALSQMLRQQQKLRDETYQQGQGKQGSGQLGDLAKDQQSLRSALGDLMRELGEGAGDIPSALGRAERAMRDAEAALGQGQSSDALAPQGQSLDQLRAGAEAMAKALREENARAEAQQGQGEGGSPRSENDPLGRPLASDPGGSAAIPQQFDIERALQIRRELEQRASQRRRPPQELDYIDRLLKLF